MSSNTLIKLYSRCQSKKIYTKLVAQLSLWHSLVASVALGLILTSPLRKLNNCPAQPSPPHSTGLLQWEIVAVLGRGRSEVGAINLMTM
jgi:hypothetical protein